MGREERAAWIGLVVAVIGLGGYVVVMAGTAASVPVERIDWLAAMVWTVVASIVVSIVANIVWGVVAERRAPRGSNAPDERDREISRMGERVGNAFLVLAGIGAIALCALEAAPFWIANVLFAGFAVSAVVGTVARVIAYRRGLV